MGPASRHGIIFFIDSERFALFLRHPPDRFDQKTGGFSTNRTFRSSAEHARVGAFIPLPVGNLVAMLLRTLV